MGSNTKAQEFKEYFLHSDNIDYKAWHENYIALEQFYMEHSHTIIRDKTNLLYSWSKTQRSARKNKKLNKQQIYLLDILKFDWTGTRRVPALNPYKVNLPFLCPTEKKECHIVKSGKYRGVQRYRCYACGKDFSPFPTAIDFSDYTEWDGVLFSEETGYVSWYLQFQDLKEFKGKYGHTFPPQRGEEFKKLSGYVAKCRQYYKKGTLHPLKIKKLNSIGFEWSYIGSVTQRKRASLDLEKTPKETLWDNKLTELKAFKAEHGHSNVTQGKPGFKVLGKWVNEQRRLHNENKLPTHRVKKLDKIDFIWNVPMHMYEEKVNRYKKFFKRHKSWFVNPNLTPTAWDKKVSQEIAQTICCGFGTYKTVEKRKMMAAIGFPTNGDRGKPIAHCFTYSDYTKVKRLINKKMSQEEIAKKLGLTLAVYRKKLKQAQQEFKK